MSSTNAQNSLSAEYLEVFPFGTGWEFRASPSNAFQSVGFLGENIAPYFEGNDGAQDAFRRYKVNQGVAIASNFTMIAGASTILYGLSKENRTAVRAGLIADFAGLAFLYISSRNLNKNLYQAVDLYNYRRNPVPLQSSLIPSIRMSQHSLGMGLVWDIQ